jgi:hypothetical protein
LRSAKSADETGNEQDSADTKQQKTPTGNRGSPETGRRKL